MNREKGFTLVEIMIVLVVIGVLAAFLVPRYQGMKEEALNSATDQQLKAVETALYSYANHNDGVFPGATGGGNRITAMVDSLNNARPRIVTAKVNDEFGNQLRYYHRIYQSRYYYFLVSSGMNARFELGTGNFSTTSGEPMSVDVSGNVDDLYVTNMVVQE